MISAELSQVLQFLGPLQPTPWALPSANPDTGPYSKSSWGLQIFLRSSTSFCFVLIALRRPWPLRRSLSGGRSDYGNDLLTGFLPLLLLTRSICSHDTIFLPRRSDLATFLLKNLHWFLVAQEETLNSARTDSELDPGLLASYSYALPTFQLFFTGPALSHAVLLLKFKSDHHFSRPSSKYHPSINFFQNTPSHLRILPSWYSQTCYLHLLYNMHCKLHC